MLGLEVPSVERHMAVVTDPMVCRTRRARSRMGDIAAVCKSERPFDVFMIRWMSARVTNAGR
jgi:hypothetical protein